MAISAVIWLSRMLHSRMPLAAILMAGAIGGCASVGGGTAGDHDELARTLESAQMVFPDGSLSERWSSYWVRKLREVRPQLAGLRPESKMPLVIYMHGCDGWVAGSVGSEVQFIAAAGFAVLAPDSFARQNKQKHCDADSKRGGIFRSALRYRLAEARHAHEAALTMPWVDQRNIFIIGFSEGGLTAAKYGHGGLAGRVVLGWTCNAGWSEYVGISGPLDEPILAIVADEDPWFQEEYDKGHCGEFFVGRSNADSFVIDHRGHYVHGLPDVRKKVLAFLSAHLTR